MTLKTTRAVATFNEPFSLRNMEGLQPAGTYAVFVEDELITNLSRTAWRRVATLLQTPSISSSQANSRLVVVSQTELDAALMKDLHQTVASEVATPGIVERQQENDHGESQAEGPQTGGEVEKA